MKFCFLIVFSLIISFFGMNSAFGSASGKVIFTDTEIEKFISDWPGFFTWYKNEKPWKKLNLKGNVNITMVRDGVFFFNGVENLPEVVNFLDGIGWQSEHFFYVMNQASKGLAYQEMKDEVPKQQASMRKEIETLQKDNNMPKKVLKQVISDLTEAINELGQSLKEQRISDEELAVVTKYSTQLKQLFE